MSEFDSAAFDAFEAKGWTTKEAEAYDALAGRVTSRLAGPLLDAVAAGTGSRLLDVATGPGYVAAEAAGRGAEPVGLDFSQTMLAHARTQVSDVEFVLGDATALPFEDGSFDAAMSSFVFQLVPNRSRALREARRVLRPGGTLAYVTWLQDDRVFAPDIDLDDALDEVGIGAREPDGRPGDVESPEHAVRELRRAGYRDATATRALLEHPFDVEGYVAFITQFDEADTYESLQPDERDLFDRSIRERLGRRRGEELVLRLPVVAARATRN